MSRFRDKDRPTHWHYEDGKPVPIWHAVDTLESHFCFGYRDYIVGKPREYVEGRNGNPDYRNAQLAGWDRAREDDHEMREKGFRYGVAMLSICGGCKHRVVRHDRVRPDGRPGCCQDCDCDGASDIHV